MSDQIPVLVIAGGHSFSGVVDHGNQRILDVLNDASTGFLRIQRVTVFHGIQGEPLAEFEEATLVKSSIDLAVLTDQTHEAPLRQRYAFVEKQKYSAFLSLATYTVRGNVQLKGRPDPLAVLGRESPTFFPLTEVSISRGEKPLLEARVAMVNKSMATLMQIGHQ